MSNIKFVLCLQAVQLCLEFNAEVARVKVITKREMIVR